MPHQQISLYYKDGKSDKVYHAQIENQDSGYVVNFQYGRRGATLATGSKTTSPVTLEKAQSIFNSLVKDKTAKGYTEGESGSIFQSVSLEERFTGNVPQLLNAFPRDEKKREILLAKLLQDNNWIMQEKHDGWRTMINKKEKVISASNKKALSVAIPQNLVDKFTQISVDALFDGELIGENYYIFDLLELNGENLRSLNVLERLERLNTIKEVSSMVTKVFRTTDEKTNHLKKLKTDKKEGAVFKKIDALYVPGRPASGGNQLKYKFMEESTMFVISHNDKKRSIEVGVYDENKNVVNLGNVTIYTNQEMPAVGAIVEIRYMHCFIGGSIYVSQLKCLRPDQDLSDCNLAQIKFKPLNAEDDEE